MPNSDSDIEIVKVKQAMDSQETNLLEKANVVGVGVGYKESKGKETDEVCLNVYVTKKEKKLSENDLVPKIIEGIKTDVREVGVIEAQAFTSRIRPAKPGFSIGHYRITAGTFGCLVRDTCNPCQIYMLSNNHVFANSNGARIGDPILQPGRYDGGTYPKDVIAKLTRFVPIRFNDPSLYNLVDAALATPTDLHDVISPIVGLGIPKGTIEATLGMEVVKSGRTTETTRGKVIGVDATVAVNYGVGVGYFRNQIITSNMSQGGDSGSLLLSRATNEATGLLFAGSSQVTIHNNIVNVLMSLGVEIVSV
jgi:hypothetical protein